MKTKMLIACMSGLMTNGTVSRYTEFTHSRLTGYPVPNTKRGKFKGHHRGKK